jgi:hypothetical protein
MPFPTEAVRSELYATLIGGGIVAQPTSDFFCLECGQETWACECALQPYQGADMTPYRTKEHNHGNRR